MKEIKDYYETYWSKNGFYPRGRIWPGLTVIYQQYIPAKSKVLDIGCGDGQTSGFFLRYNDHDYVGVDISENAVHDARSIGLNAHRVEDAANLPFLGDAFDAVVCIEVMEHLFEPNLVVKEIYRVLKPGGVFIATVPNIAFWRWRLDFFLLGRWNPIGDELSVERPWRDPHIRFFTVGSLKRLVGLANFRSIKVSGHDGGIVRFIPYVRKAAKKRNSSLYRLIEKYFPSLFAYRLHAICRK